MQRSHALAVSHDVPHSILLSVKHQPGALQEVLEILKQSKLNLAKIESRPSAATKDAYDILLHFDEATANISACVDALKVKALSVTLLSSHGDVAWFPRRPSDFDTLSTKVVSYGDELAPNHPGYHDEAYRRRRKELGVLALGYRHGHPIPRVEYTASELETWRTIFRKLTALYPTHACAQFNRVFPLLQKHCQFSEDTIPQLEDVSNFLKQCTGWTIRPVAGLLSSRDFLNAMAFRVFHSTQYIRHHSVPMYTPEPDVCHELLGHVPLFADPEFAEFSQQLGLASLGATDEQINLIGTVYWYTVEFGLCKEDGQLKAYGAGLLSSFGELEYCLSGKPKVEAFEPRTVSTTQYDITNYQPLYFVTESFEDATQKLRAFAESMPRPFAISYNPYTQTIEVLDSRRKIIDHTKKLQRDLSTLVQALERLQ